MLSGAEKTNKKKGDPFGYLYQAFENQSDFIFEHLSGPGLAGLHGLCGYNKYRKEADGWEDEYLSYVTENFSVKSDLFNWAGRSTSTSMSNLGIAAAKMMYAYQVLHLIWLQHWHFPGRNGKLGACNGTCTRGVLQWEPPTT